MSDSICDCSNKNMVLGPYCFHKAEPFLEFMNAKWAFHILSIFERFDDAIRFSTIEEELKNTGANFSPRTLTSRLKEAEKLGLIHRTIYPEIPPKVEYHLTEKGKSFHSAVKPLLKWIVSCQGYKTCKCDN